MEENGSNYIDYINIAIASQHNKVIHKKLHLRGSEAFEALDCMRRLLIASISVDKINLKEMIDGY